MNTKCFVFLTSKAGAKVKKATYNPEDGTVTYRERLLKKAVAIVPYGADYDAKPYRRGKNIFLVDAETKIVCKWGGSVTLSSESSKHILDKLDLLSRNKLWAKMGGRDLTLVETLIFLSAGYGVLRWVEYLITTMYA